MRLKVYERQFFSSGKARLFFTFGAWVRVFRFFFSSLLAVFFCFSVKLVWVFGIRNFFFCCCLCLWIFRHFV